MPNYNSESLNCVPVEPLADAVIRSGMSFSEAAYRCGWTRKHRNLIVGDATRLKRRLGLSEYTSRGRKRKQEYISYENAVIICKAVNADPFEVGI